MTRAHELAVAALHHFDWDAASTIKEIEVGRLSEVSRSAVAGAELVEDFRSFLSDLRLLEVDVDINLVAEKYAHAYLNEDELQVMYPAVDVLRYFADVDPAAVACAGIAA